MEHDTDNHDAVQPPSAATDGATRYWSDEPSRQGRDTGKISDRQGPSHSIRLTPRSSHSGLAMRLALPIILTMLAALIILSLYVRRQVFDLQLASLENGAANAAFATAMLGRLVLNHREAFLRDHPDYPDADEWLAGDHWLVAHGFVDPEIWKAETGFDPGEYAPIAALERAAGKTVFADLARWLNASSPDTELVAVFLVDADGSVLAGAVDASFHIESPELRSVPAPEAARSVGHYRVAVDYLPGFKPEPVVRGTALILSPEDSEQVLGRSVVFLRTAPHARERHSFLLMCLGLAALTGAFMSLVCWYAARRVTKPLRRLAADIHAMAMGEYDIAPEVPYTGEIAGVVQALRSLAERLRIARANEKEKIRLENELNIARDIQNHLLPLQTPRVRGLDIHTSYRPARAVGGDYFDFLPVDNQHMGIIVADASGKSIPAALLVSTTRAILRFVAPGNESAAETLTRVNAILSVDIPSRMFVTAYYLVMDPVEKRLLCASAGHTPMLVARTDDSVELVNPGGIALGFNAGSVFQRAIREQEVRLQPGDRVLLYTDGVVECVNPANEEYSERRLREFLRRNRDLSSHDFVGALMADLDRHRGAAEMRDDTTVVTFKVL